MTKLSTRLIALLFFIAAVLAIPVSEAGEATVNLAALPVYQPKFQPFENGEKGLYRAHWNGLFSVATAEITVTPTLLDGKKAYYVKVEAKSSKILDLFWKMRDTITSTFNAQAFAPSRFTFRQRENSKVIDTEALYSEAAKKWSVKRQERGEKDKIYEFDSQNTLDPITTVYLSRSLDFNVGDWLYFKVFGGKYQYLLQLHVASKEPVTMPSGKSVEAYKIIPYIQNITKDGYASRFNEATIWISADERRLPIKMSSKIFVGNIYLELISDQAGLRSTSADTTQPPT